MKKNILLTVITASIVGNVCAYYTLTFYNDTDIYLSYTFVSTLAGCSISGDIAPGEVQAHDTSGLCIGACFNKIKVNAYRTDDVIYAKLYAPDCYSHKFAANNRGNGYEIHPGIPWVPTSSTVKYPAHVYQDNYFALYRERLLEDHDINKQNGRGETLLMILARRGVISILNTMLADTKVDVNAHNNRNGYTALIYAVDNNQITAVEKLIAAKAQVDAQDKNGRTALMVAAVHGSSDIIQKLIAAKADLSIKDKKGETALMLAAENGNLNVIKLFIDAGSDVNAKDNNGVSIISKVRAQFSSGNANYQEIATMLQNAGAR